MVIYPSAAEWKSAPDIEEGANVRQDQVLLLIPDLSQMQVKVGIHESKVDRLKVNMDATVSLLEEQLEGRVASIASVTKPAGWWTGNVVKYDTIVELKPDQDVPLKPGMSVEVQVKIAEHTDVLTIPVAAVVEHEQAYFAWVMTSKGPERRELEVGDSNDEFMVVKTGLKEGDEVIINPRAHVEEARSEALKPVDPSEKKSSAKKDSSDDDSKKTPEAQQQPDAKSESKPDAAEAKAGTKESKTEASPATPSAADLAAKAISEQDQDGDGALSIDEYKEEHRKYFDLTDTNGDGKVDKSEMQAAIQRIIDASKAQQE